MKNIIHFLIIGLAIVACSPEARRHRQEQKVARLLKKNPQLINQDTVRKEIDVKVPSLLDTAEVTLKPDTNRIDSLIGHFKGKVDNVVLDSLKDGFKDILKHSGDIDTIVKSKKSAIHIKKKGNNLTVDIVSVPSIIKVDVPVSITTIKVPEIELRWYERLFKQIKETAGAIGFSLIFLLILYIIYRIIKRSLK